MEEELSDIRKKQRPLMRGEGEGCLYEHAPKTKKKIKSKNKNERNQTNEITPFYLFCSHTK